MHMKVLLKEVNHLQDHRSHLQWNVVPAIDAHPRN